MNLDLLEAAERAFDSNSESPYLTSSPMDMAHRVGQWARAHSIRPSELKAGRGYTWTLNRSIRLTFRDGNDPTLVTPA